MMSDGRSAQHMSLFNGLFALAATLAKRGLMNEADLQTMHSWMLKPLDLEEHAENPGIEKHKMLIDELVSVIRAEIK